MIQRKTQTAEYWQQFSLTAGDTDFLRNLLLDAGRPLTTRELAQALVAERCRREEADLRAEMSRGSLYQPKKSFATGERVIFPMLDFRAGEVVAVRAGENPEFGEFSVITVDFGPDRRQRDFAANLAAPHKLNADAPSLVMAGDLHSPEKLLDTVAKHVPASLAGALAQEPNLATFEDRWLLRDLLAEIHVGHLNIAEALIDMRTSAIETTTLVSELDLPAEIDPEIRAFSVHSALSADARFDQVGAGEERRWFLRRLEPAEALSIPPALVYEPVAFDPATLPPDLRQLAWDIDDEWADDLDNEAASTRAGLASATLLLLYPHQLSGTLPLNRRSQPFFPKGHGERTMVTLIDGRWGNRFPAWVNHQGRYVAGLQPWYEKHKLPAGAFITLERRDESGEVVVDYRPKRMRREWTRWAQVGEGGRLDVQLRKQEVACEYDEHIIIGDDKAEQVIKLREAPFYIKSTLRDLVFEAFTDLAGLSQAGVVHAKTIYSTVNVLRRCPPAPIFAALATETRLESAGDGQYRLVA